MSSQVAICNLALAKFGDTTIISIDDATAQARSCKALWDILRDDLLVRAPWNFAMARSDLGAPLADAPAFEYDYAYTIPADCLRVWEFYGKPKATQWVVEGRKFLTNETEEIYIRYISKDDDAINPENFSQAFSTCLSLRMAMELAPKFGNKGAAQTIRQEYVMALSEAQALNAIEGERALTYGEKPLESGEYSWQTEGREWEA